MEVSVEDLSSVKKMLHIEIPEDTITRELDKAYNDLRKKVKLRGFRPGKAPMSIIKNRFGEAIRAEVLDEVIQDFYRKAVDEKGLSVVAPGTIKDIQYHDDAPLKFTAEVEVEPVPEAASYKELKVVK